jgi:hypothetical protein
MKYNKKPSDIIFLSSNNNSKNNKILKNKLEWKKGTQSK